MSSSLFCLNIFLIFDFTFIFVFLMFSRVPKKIQVMTLGLQLASEKVFLLKTSKSTEHLELVAARKCAECCQGFLKAAGQDETSLLGS